MAATKNDFLWYRSGCTSELGGRNAYMAVPNALNPLQCQQHRDLRAVLVDSVDLAPGFANDLRRLALQHRIHKAMMDRAEPLRHDHFHTLSQQLLRSKPAGNTRDTMSGSCVTRSKQCTNPSSRSMPSFTRTMYEPSLMVQQAAGW